MSVETPAEIPPNLVDLLDKLVVPPEPAPVSMVPQTAGWIIVAALLLVMMALAVVRHVRQRRRNAYRRAALAALEDAGDDPAQIAVVLRRCALAAYPRAKVAGLSGEDWLAFLDETLGRSAFSSGPGQHLATAPYRATTPASPELAALARDWITGHRSEIAP